MSSIMKSSSFGINPKKKLSTFGRRLKQEITTSGSSTDPDVVAINNNYEQELMMKETVSPDDVIKLDKITEGKSLSLFLSHSARLSTYHTNHLPLPHHHLH